MAVDLVQVIIPWIIKHNHIILLSFSVSQSLNHSLTAWADKKIGEKDATIQALTKELDKRDASIHSLTKEIEETEEKKDAAIHSLTQKLQALTKELDKKDDAIHSLTQEIEETEVFKKVFSLVLTKVNCSLGFTLCQTDHTIKALVKEPAKSDGRIRPGDKLLYCNGVNLSGFSHQELITFLRQCPDVNSLTLYRDTSQI